ncbi:MAG TPA: permease-like cell division protein FtsX [Bdellovibrionales bacterium]|nr:permease-like cell division protein FtsX [Bdellovibrionales bacterium]
MTSSLFRQHLFRAWSRHWALQLASVTVMTVVLAFLNLMFLGFSSFNAMVDQWGRGLEMVVYLREGAASDKLAEFQKRMETSGDFDEIRFTPKAEATQRFLRALGPESKELLNDPKWSSPIPASFELRLSERIAVTDRLASLQGWSAQFRALEYVDDVFYGQGWVENFSRFLSSARGLLAVLWIVSLSVGLLIVSNCIRLSFLQRRDEIEVLELVGATPRFIRLPFLLEGLTLGVMASVLSLGFSFGAHTLLLGYLAQKWNFWMALQDVSALEPTAVLLNLISGALFGTLGAWNCVRKINTGWSAAAQ